jgi:hypothetical protein
MVALAWFSFESVVSVALPRFAAGHVIVAPA